MTTLSPTLSPRVAIETSSTSGDCVLEDCFIVVPPLGDGAIVKVCVCTCTWVYIVGK